LEYCKKSWSQPS